MEINFHISQIKPTFMVGLNRFHPLLEMKKPKTNEKRARNRICLG